MDLEALEKRVKALEAQVEYLAKILLKHGPNDKSKTFIAIYVNSWRKRYGVNTSPSLTGKTKGLIQTFLKEIDFDRASNLIQVYFQMDDPWFKLRCHDFRTFLDNLDKIGLALDTGKTSQESSRKSIEQLLGDNKQLDSHGVRS